MDLLEKEVAKNNNNSSKKRIILILLILCVFMLVMLLVMIAALKGKTPVKEALFVNDEEVQIDNKLLITDEQGNKYISIELAGQLIGYKFYNGGYGKNEEDRNKCYLQNNYEVVGFELNKDEIYKINLNEKIESQKFKLTNKLQKSDEGMLYASLNDFSMACNVACEMSQDGKQLKFATCDHLATLYTESIKEEDKYKSVTEDYYNKKAIYYNMIIVSDGVNYGVIDNSLKTIIGAKYKSLLFNEYIQCFIAQSNGKYGILSKEGNVQIKFEYDSIKLLNYDPLLYQVSQNDKYGVLDKDGNKIIDIEYDNIGYNYQNKEQSELLLIVEDINNKNEKGLVVCKDGKYGIINIKTGETILNCELEKIYKKTLEDGTQNYYIQIKGYEYELEEYVEYINTTTVITN